MLKFEISLKYIYLYFCKNLFKRNKKIEIIRKKIELHKLRFFFEKWRNYTVLMKDKYKRESFPAWVCTNKEYIMECPNSLDLRKNSLHVDQIKGKYHYLFITYWL